MTLLFVGITVLFDQPVDHLPQQLTTLRLPYFYTSYITLDYIPPTTRLLRLTELSLPYEIIFNIKKIKQYNMHLVNNNKFAFK